MIWTLFVRRGRISSIRPRPADVCLEDGNGADWLGFQIVVLGSDKGGGIGGRLEGSCVACEG